MNGKAGMQGKRKNINNIIKVIKSTNSPSRIILKITEGDILKSNPKILSAILQRTLQNSQEYNFGPWTETSDISDAERDADRFLKLELKEKILSIIEKSKEPWKIFEPVFGH
jgi:hypothetical protein